MMKLISSSPSHSPSPSFSSSTAASTSTAQSHIGWRDASAGLESSAVRQPPRPLH